MVHKPTKTGYKGVSFSGGKKNPYLAHIGQNGKILYLGIFLTAEEAARAYDEKAKELFGEYACPNFPQKT